jgi:hypothetical protein
MKRLTCFIAVVLLFCSFGVAEDNTGIKTRQQISVTGMVTAVPVTFDNDIGGMTATFEEIFAGAPASSSILLQGCMRGGTCDTLETNVGNANSNRHPAIATVYDYFLITPTLTGGTSPTLTVNYTVTVSH